MHLLNAFMDATRVRSGVRRRPALVAQGIEHGSPKAGVAGSNPAGGTRSFRS